MRRYLTGIDWIVHTLDYLGRKRTGIGNISQIVLELGSCISEEDLRNRLNICLQAIPALCGYPARSFNFCPYWKVTPCSSSLTLNIFRLKGNADFTQAHDIFQSYLDKPFKHKREHLVFNLVYFSDKSFLGMIFDHRLFDARGAEAFLSMLGSDNSNPLPLNSVKEPSNLNNWLNKFRAGKKVNKVFLSLTSARPRVLPSDLISAKSRLKIFTFNSHQSSKIAEDSYKTAGYLMFMPYLFAKSIVCLNSIFEGRNILPADYLIPVSVDNRPAALVKKEPFFNNLSFFLFRIKNQEAGDFAFVLDTVKKQLYEQVSIGLPEAIKEASFLLRIAPLPLVDLFLRTMSKGEVASFAFAFVGESVFTSKTFCGASVMNVLHFPRMPLPPGVGIFFSQFQGRLNVAFSFIEGLLSEGEIQQVSECLKGLA